MPLTPDAKKLLAETIRGTAQDPDKGIRARLLRAIHDEADRRYRLSVPIERAELDEANRRRRERIEAWIDERARATKPKNKTELKATKDRLLAQAEKEAAATLVNRLVLVRHLEALGLSKPHVLTGGWSSKGYREFREFAPTLCTNGTADATEGYASLLQLLYDELASELPGLFGDVGLTRLFPIPPATLRDVVERLDDPALASAWTDDTTLGWVYQFWNDFERDALDAKALDGGKIEPHELASKTQMFTDRYIVEWLLQNSLGLTWLAICKKHAWRPDADRVLPILEERRADWRSKRESGEVALDALMPIAGELEEHWKYYVAQEISEDAVDAAPESIRAIRILDPACGSGHFLIIAFDMLAALYREEARHRGVVMSEKAIAESILENNLHGIDIDQRAIQIAAALLYVKAKTFAKDAQLQRVNLVAPVLQLGNLPSDDPAVVALRKDLETEVGIPEELTNKLIAALAGVDHIGSLLRVDGAVEEALQALDHALRQASQRSFVFVSDSPDEERITEGTGPHALLIADARASVMNALETFLLRHSRSEDLGLRIDGEDLAAGVRFVRMTRERSFDLVVGNPPYQGITKTVALGYVAKAYPRGKADLCTAFLERSLDLAKPGGLSAMVAMRAWMFLGQFGELREHLRRDVNLLTLGDLDKGAFESMPTSQMISVAMTVFRNAPRSTNTSSLALQPTAPGEKFWGPDRTNLKRAAILAQRNRFEFDPRGFEVIEGEPIVYWWSKDFLAEYAAAPKLGDSSPAKAGAVTGNHVRFLRKGWELPADACVNVEPAEALRVAPRGWVRYVKGARGMCWMDPCDELCNWRRGGLEIKVLAEHLYGSYTRQIRNESLFFKPGIAVAAIGASFSARLYRWRAIFDNMAASIFPDDTANALCSMNSSTSRSIVQSLNPGLHFEISDVNRLPLLQCRGATAVVDRIREAFHQHERHRESSVEFAHPGPSPWTYAQSWAQRAVDRSDTDPIPAYEPIYAEPAPESFVSFAIGVALGRFSADGEGILYAQSTSALPHGILFVSTEASDSLDHGTARPIVDAWAEHGAVVGEGDDLRTYLRKSFFDYQKKLYEKRPIYFPLSSARKNFVAFASIHRWTDDLLSVLLADHLVPAKRRLDGELDDLRVAKASGANKGKAEKRFVEVQKLLEELDDFIAKTTEIADRGTPPPDDKTTKREVDARYVMDLDDGVMVNSAALWPLLEPQWKDPKKWWKELANAQGKKDYDWSHLAARYFPARVRKKCHEDPSLAVAHKCFWELHPAKAYAWELRLQDEIRPDFTIDEPGSDEARAKFLRHRDREAREILAKEMKRREKKSSKEEDGDAGPLFEATDDDAMEEADA